MPFFAPHFRVSTGTNSICYWRMWTRTDVIPRLGVIYGRSSVRADGVLDHQPKPSRSNIELRVSELERAANQRADADENESRASVTL